MYLFEMIYDSKSVFPTTGTQNGISLIEPKSLSEQTEMKGHQKLQLSPTRLLSCWRLATQKFACQKNRHGFRHHDFTIFQLAFLISLSSTPNISIWHTHCWCKFVAFIVLHWTPKKLGHISNEFFLKQHKHESAIHKSHPLTHHHSSHPNLLADTMVQSSRFQGSVSAMEACETSSEIMEAWIFKVWNLESNGFQSEACLQIWGSPSFLSQESRPIVLSTAIFHEFAVTSSTCCSDTNQRFEKLVSSEESQW